MDRDKQEFESKLRALRLDLEHMENSLQGTKNHKQASNALDEAHGALQRWGDLKLVS